MKWRKGGRIFAPSGELWWARAYATLPTAEVIDDQYIRVYFASVDRNNFGSIGYVDLDIDNPNTILDSVLEPILTVGELGAFDDSGANPSSIVTVRGQKRLYYIGWQRAERVPYMLFSGLAIRNEGDSARSFSRYSRVPVLERTSQEPFSRSAPFVLHEDNLNKAWYWSCTHWTMTEGIVHYNNVIKYVESADGLNWPAEGRICLMPTGDDYSVGRPWVLKDGATYKMWYSIRSRSRPYRIGYAESSDGIHWNRKDDEVGITSSETGWDSEMICYPCVIDVPGRRYMFYNGNGHGASGFGYAVLEQD